MNAMKAIFSNNLNMLNELVLVLVPVLVALVGLVVVVKKQIQNCCERSNPLYLC